MSKTRSKKYQITLNPPWLLFDNDQLVAFVDASGNIDKQERFFGVGMLMVENPGAMTDELYFIAQKVMALSKSCRNKTVDKLANSGKYKEAIKILKKTKRFELKYDRISPVKSELYKEMVNIFLKNSKCRFSCVVRDNKKSAYNNPYLNNWDGYTDYVASLIAPELKKLNGSNISLILDEIPKPRLKNYSLEETVLDKIKNNLKNINCNNEKVGKIMNVIRIESHSNLLMQLTDVILGIVMYDFKKRENLLSLKSQQKKEEVIDELRKGLSRATLAGTYTKNNPVYFNVLEPSRSGLYVCG